MVNKFPKSRLHFSAMTRRACPATTIQTLRPETVTVISFHAESLNGDRTIGPTWGDQNKLCGGALERSATHHVRDTTSLNGCLHRPVTSV